MTPSEKPQTESPFLVERLMRHALLREEAVFASEDEFRASVSGQDPEALASARLEALESEPRELAQELAYQAYECGDAEQALALADRALALDDRNCDALTVRAFLVCEDVGELIGQLEHAATCGERRLGEEFFAEFMGDFWPMVEARPYMRTIKQLAEVLWSVGRRLDAVEHYENLLDLDPADHMGNGILLVGDYLAMGEVQRAWDLLEELEAEGTAAAWAWVLLLVLVEDDEAARDALRLAMEANPYVAPWFVNMGDPEAEPVTDAFVAPGSEDEARVCADILGEGWLRDPDAQWWLHDVLVEMGLLEDEQQAWDRPGPPAAPN